MTAICLVSDITSFTFPSGFKCVEHFSSDMARDNILSTELPLPHVGRARQGKHLAD